MSAAKENAFSICERVAEAQTILNDHFAGGRGAPVDVLTKLNALFNEQGLLRAMWEVGYFPPDTLPPAVIADH
ncbi:MAG: hypothetical protein GC182_08410 [Rhodopseudomonas sp.]|nr:hypothetical protein [Rhodopseudomonas sp.]